MGKHRLQKERNVTRSVRGVMVAGAVTVGVVGMAAAPAAAQTITIPGIGDFEVPDMPAAPVLPPMPAPAADVAPAAPVMPGLPDPSAPLLPGLPSINQLIPGFQWPGAPVVPGLPSSTGVAALKAAETKVGAPYVWGAAGPNSFDCSGLIQWAYKQAGVEVPRTTYSQVDAGTPVARPDLQPGDEVIFYGGEHAGLYAGNGMVLHASQSGQPVKLAPVDSMPFFAARRF